jgi:hypothetical protein
MGHEMQKFEKRLDSVEITEGDIRQLQREVKNLKEAMLKQEQEPIQIVSQVPED